MAQKRKRLPRGTIRTVRRPKAMVVTARLAKAKVVSVVTRTEGLEVTGKVQPQSVPAPNFLFRVPVTAKKLHADITHGRVNCIVTRSPHFIPNPLVNIGQGLSQPFPSIKGRFSGTVVISCDAFTGKNCDDAKSYRCDLHLKVRNKWVLAPRNDPSHPMDATKPFRPMTQGKIDRG